MKEYITFLICCIALLLVGCSDSTSIENADFIEVTLHHDYADEVELMYALDGLIEKVPMDRISAGHYRLDMNLPEDNSLLFNIRLTNNYYPDAELWVARPIGIDAIKVSTNDVVLTNDYLIYTQANPSAAFSIVKADGVIEFGGGVKCNPKLDIPPEFPHYREYCEMQLPPEGFCTVLPWLQTVQLYGESEDSLVEIDYIRCYAHLSSGDVLLYEDDYNEDIDVKSFANGSLYYRYPLLYDEAKSTWNMPARVENGSLIITPNTNTDRVFHWWQSSRSIIPEDAEYVWIKASIRITGPAYVQSGIDFWRDENARYEGLNVNNVEAAVSDVYFDDGSGEWQIIVLSTKDIIKWRE